MILRTLDNTTASEVGRQNKEGKGKPFHGLPNWRGGGQSKISGKISSRKRPFESIYRDGIGSDWKVAFSRLLPSARYRQEGGRQKTQPFNRFATYPVRSTVTLGLRMALRGMASLRHGPTYPDARTELREFRKSDSTWVTEGEARVSHNLGHNNLFTIQCVRMNDPMNSW